MVMFYIKVLENEVWTNSKSNDFFFSYLHLLRLPTRLDQQEPYASEVTWGNWASLKKIGWEVGRSVPVDTFQLSAGILMLT